MKTISKVLLLSLVVVGTIKTVRENDFDELTRALQLSADCKQAIAKNKENKDSICDQFKQVQADINDHLRKIAQLKIDEKKVREALTWRNTEAGAADWLFHSDEYKNYQNALNNFSNGIMTEEEKNAAHAIMLKSDAYKKYALALDEEKKNRNSSNEIGIQLRNEPLNLRKVVSLRYSGFMKEVESFIDSSKMMEQISAKFPMDYAVEELDKILKFEKAYIDALLDARQAIDSRKVAETGLKYSTKIEDYNKKLTQYKLGLLTKEELDKEETKLKESDIWKDHQSKSEKADEAEQKAKELHEQLIDVLKAPYFRQNQ